ncbi:hypothetical protein V7149_18140, partial [Bacillus sp. JJ1503]|uniref:hypothetical protein n=1 Tax=Bacillus sp. JJ1503 TaxID=3122956 RepID=UPI002FFE0E06
CSENSLSMIFFALTHLNSIVKETNADTKFAIIGKIQENLCFFINNGIYVRNYMKLPYFCTHSGTGVRLTQIKRPNQFMIWSAA